jgi:hypothetical protein
MGSGLARPSRISKTSLKTSLKSDETQEEKAPSPLLKKRSNTLDAESMDKKIEDVKETSDKRSLTSGLMKPTQLVRPGNTTSTTVTPPATEANNRDTSTSTTAAATSNNITTSIVASNSLQRGLCELLGTSSSVFTHTPKMPHFSIESAATYSMSLIQSKSNIGVSLLHPLDSELSRYLQRQISRREKKIIMNQINDNQLDISIFTESNNDVDLSQSSLTPTCSNCSSGSDASSGSYSIKSNSSNTATCSSKDTMSSDYVMENKTIIQMAHSLESLCKYSRDVREVILLQPHKMNLSDSVISCDEEENMNEGTDDYNITDYSFTTPDQATELSSNLIPFNKSGNRSPRLDKFFLKTTQEYYFTNDHVCSNTSRLSYTGTSLLDTLFGLINNLFWKEDYELLLSVVETLSILAHYCPDELLYK